MKKLKQRHLREKQEWDIEKRSYEKKISELELMSSLRKKNTIEVKKGRAKSTKSETTRKIESDSETDTLKRKAAEPSKNSPEKKVEVTLKVETISNEKEKEEEKNEIVLKSNKSLTTIESLKENDDADSEEEAELEKLKDLSKLKDHTRKLNSSPPKEPENDSASFEEIDSSVVVKMSDPEPDEFPKKSQDSKVKDVKMNFDFLDSLPVRDSPQKSEKEREIELHLFEQFLGSPKPQKTNSYSVEKCKAPQKKYNQPEQKLHLLDQFFQPNSKKKPSSITQPRPKSANPSEDTNSSTCNLNDSNESFTSLCSFKSTSSQKAPSEAEDPSTPPSSTANLSHNLKIKPQKMKRLAFQPVRPTPVDNTTFENAFSSSRTYFLQNKIQRPAESMSVTEQQTSQIKTVESSRPKETKMIDIYSNSNQAISATKKLNKVPQTSQENRHLSSSVSHSRTNASKSFTRKSFNTRTFPKKNFNQQILSLESATHPFQLDFSNTIPEIVSSKPGTNNSTTLSFGDGITGSKFSDGTVMVNMNEYRKFFYPNGDILIEFKDGKKAYLYSQTKIEEVQVPDLATYIQFPNGQKEKHLSNGGGTVVETPDGNISFRKK